MVQQYSCLSALGLLEFVDLVLVIRNVLLMHAFLLGNFSIFVVSLHSFRKAFVKYY